MEAVRRRIANVSLPSIIAGGGREPSLNNKLDVRGGRWRMTCCLTSVNRQRDVFPPPQAAKSSNTNPSRVHNAPTRLYEHAVLSSVETRTVNEIFALFAS